jgi:hypothetical protein
LHISPLSQLKPQPVEWFWPGYLAVGSLAILDGDPGQGKSLVTLDLAARITTGRPWPDQRPMPHLESPTRERGSSDDSPGSLAHASGFQRAAANVLMICAEDLDSIIHARLQAAGADLDRVFLWPRSEDGRLPSFPADLLRLDLALTQTQAKLVVLDPIMSFLDRSVMSASDASVRRALGPLSALAAKHGCVILMVRHLNKSPSTRGLYRGGGSIGFIAACRLAWLAATDPRNDDRFILAQTKNNYAPRQASLAYEIGSCGRTFPTCEFGHVENVSPHPPDPPRETAPMNGSRSFLPSPSVLRGRGVGGEGEVAPRKGFAALKDSTRGDCSASDDGNRAAPHITWLGPAAWTADELSTRRPRPSRRRARDFLKRLLAAGPRSAGEVWTAARQLGLSRNTLYRAKDDLQVEAIRSSDGQRRLSQWFLPEHAMEIPSETPELDAWLNRWHELNIDANPLEDDEPRRFAG